MPDFVVLAILFLVFGSIIGWAVSDYWRTSKSIEKDRDSETEAADREKG